MDIVLLVCVCSALSYLVRERRRGVPQRVGPTPGVSSEGSRFGRRCLFRVDGRFGRVGWSAVAGVSGLYVLLTVMPEPLSRSFRA